MSTSHPPSSSSAGGRVASVLSLALLLQFVFLDHTFAQARLTVVGRELRYEGRRVVLHGVGMGDPVLARQNRPTSDYNRLATEWQSNAVRLAIHPGTWKNYNHDFVITQLRREVDATVASGQFVIITWHVIGCPDSFFQNSANDPDFYDSNFAPAQDYWTRIAQAFGNEGRVVFELWNEPVNAVDSQVRLPRWHQIKPFYEQLIAIVRQHSNNLILATGNNYAFDLRGITVDPLVDANAAYTWHVYADGPIDRASLSIFLGGVDSIAPVVVSEWGFNFSDSAQWSADAAGFGPAFVAEFLRARQLHSTAWAWAPGWMPSMVQADFSSPTLYGRFVQDFLIENQVVSARIKGPKKFETSRVKSNLRGSAVAPLGIERVEVKVGQKSWQSVRGLAQWKFPARLKYGRNRILVRATNIAGKTSPVVKLLVTRR